MLLSSPDMILLNKVFSGGNNKVSENELLLILDTYIHTFPSSRPSHDPFKGHILNEKIISPFYILGKKLTGTGN
jgi:hypothetical protein